MLAINPNRLHDFVLPVDQDKPPAEQTTFKLRVLSSAEHAAVADEFASTDANRKAQAMLRACDLALVGWSNLKDADGKDVAFPHDPALFGGKRPVDFLPVEATAGIGVHVIGLNSLRRADLGKSKQPSASASAN